MDIGSLFYKNLLFGWNEETGNKECTKMCIFLNCNRSKVYSSYWPWADVYAIYCTWRIIQATCISKARLQVHYYSEVLPTQHGYYVGVSRMKRHRQLRVKDFPKVSRAGFIPVTLRTKGDEPTNEPPRPIKLTCLLNNLLTHLIGLLTYRRDKISYFL